MEVVDHQGEVRIGDLYLWVDIINLNEPTLFMVQDIRPKTKLTGSSKICTLMNLGNNSHYDNWKELDTELIERKWYRLISRI